MENPVQQLIEILDEQKNIIDNLIKLTRKKIDFLTCSDTDGISSVVEQEYKIKREMETADKRRMDAVLLVAAFFDIQGKTKISDIAEKAEEPYKTKLLQKRDEIIAQINEYREQNSLSCDLIKSHLNFVDYMVNIISGEKPQASSYSAKGYIPYSENQKMIDNKA